MMKIHVLGGHGGLAKNFATTSFLIDDKLLIDAGAVAGALSIEAQLRIDHILITHCHLDHIKDLAFMCDNCFGLRADPIKVHTHPTVVEIIKRHLLNDVIWPDFTKLPSPQAPTMSLQGALPESSFSAGPYNILPVKVNHAHDAMGFIVEHEDSSILFTGDTGPTDRIWEIARGLKNLKCIFTEVSFPDRLQKVADVSDHHTASTLKKELSKMPLGVKVVLTHLKPNYKEEIILEIDELKDDRVILLERDGQIFDF
jgi:ribonuclease BN (tRNA processing enzyme)